ncbi:MAG TPA: hypothetical protein VKT75_01815, partial [Acidobacteriaceae bacterium]|nr:hypothetical protein [Acidobacteriaceae bacterium]
MAQHAPTAGSTVHTGLPDDWTHHHLVFSPAGSERDAIRGGRHQDWERIVSDRRYVMLQTKRHAAATVAESRGARADSHDRSSNQHGKSFEGPGHKSVAGSIHSDWQMNLGSSATVGAGQYPAKYSFSTTAAGTCAGDASPDFVVYNTGQAGSNSGNREANIVAYDNLYSGCSGAVPTVYWSYYTGTGTAATSVVLSLDGSKVAFIETSAGGATLRILKWKAGEGTDSNAPAVPDSTSVTSWSACPASSSCLISVPLYGGYSDTISAPYYDYDSDTLWAGDSAGYLHRFTGVFLGTPTEVTSGGWPVSAGVTCGGGALSSPVYDAVHALIYVGNACGTLDAITTAGAVTTSAHIGFGFTDLQEAPLVDPAAGEVYVFVSADSYSGSAQAGVFQFPYNFSAGATGTEAQTGQATSTPMYMGTFDNSYFTSTSWSSPTGTLWVCGNTGGDPALYPISITNGIMASGAIPAGPVVSATATTCSPVTEFCTNGGADCTSSAGTDSIAVSPQTEPATPTINGCSGGEGCVITYTVSGTTATLARAGAFAGGASGMVVDTQNLATAGAFQLYFGTLGIQSCAGSGGFGTGSGGCAIQAPISGADFSLSANPTTLQLSPGGAAQAITVSATALSGFSGTVHVTFSGLPAGVTASPTTLDLTPGTPQQANFSAASNAATGTVSVQVNGVSGTLSHSVPLDVSVAATVDVVTYHNDVARTGLYPQETMLSPADVNSSQFGLLRVLAMDGKVDGQPLYLSGLTIGGQQHNVVYGVSEHDSVYAFDADTGAQIWQTSVLGANETSSDNHNCSQISPEIGITSTPVIDRQAGPHGTIFLVAMTKDSSGAYHQRLHALDVTTGVEMNGSPVEIQATYPGTGANSSGGNVIFDPGQYAARAGLLLLNGTIYMGWTSHCDQTPYTGWLMG